MSTDHQVQRMDSEEQERLYHIQNYPCAYYVQSPSTISHANSTDIKTNNQLDDSTFHYSPTRSDRAILLNKINHHPDISRFTLSRYSSSRGSNNSFLNDKKIINISSGGDNNINGGVNRLVIVDDHHRGMIGSGGYEEEEEEEEEEEGGGDEEYYYGRKIGGGGWWWRYCSFRRSSSCVWVSLQITWRVVLSLGVALLVFYIATKPPPPKMSIKMARVGQFGLGEGVDEYGVTTKILNCNCTLHLLIENKSKIFGLHIRPPILEMTFGRFPFAYSRGTKLYAESHSSTLFKLFVGTRNKPMYGAGRNMQDMLDSGNGLPIAIRLSLRSDFRVVWNLIKPRFHHQAECILVLDNSYDAKHQTQAYNSTCKIS